MAQDPQTAGAQPDPAAGEVVVPALTLGDVVVADTRMCPQCGRITDKTKCPFDQRDTIRASPQSLARIGKVIGDRYRLTELVGRGGFGDVYKAFHLGTHENVALKIMRPDLSMAANAVERFTAEARLSASLRHPNTVRVFDFGTTPDQELYLAMEFLDGVSLEVLLDGRGKLGPKRTTHLAIQILKSLAEAHSRQVVHRDLKPENIFVLELAGEKDFVRVIDFGIAKFLGDDANLTQAGAILGTPHTMSPEQVRGEALDGRSDLYALAVVMYRCLAGAYPCDGDNQFNVLAAHLTEEPPPLKHFGVHVDPALEAIVQRALCKPRQKRYPDAESMRQALENWLIQAPDDEADGDTQAMATLLAHDQPQDDLATQAMGVISPAMLQAAGSHLPPRAGRPGTAAASDSPTVSAAATAPVPAKAASSTAVIDSPNLPQLPVRERVLIAPAKASSPSRPPAKAVAAAKASPAPAASVAAADSASKRAAAKPEAPRNSADSPSGRGQLQRHRRVSGDHPVAASETATVAMDTLTQFALPPAVTTIEQTKKPSRAPLWAALALAALLAAAALAWVIGTSGSDKADTVQPSPNGGAGLPRVAQAQSAPVADRAPPAGSAQPGNSQGAAQGSASALVPPVPAAAAGAGGEMPAKTNESAHVVLAPAPVQRAAAQLVAAPSPASAASKHGEAGAAADAAKPAEVPKAAATAKPLNEKGKSSARDSDKSACPGVEGSPSWCQNCPDAQHLSAKSKHFCACRNARQDTAGLAYYCACQFPNESNARGTAQWCKCNANDPACE